MNDIIIEQQIQRGKGAKTHSDPMHPRIYASAHLKNLLEKKNCFKLICGAGNQNLDEVEKLVALYSKAGCRFFDLAADEEVLKSAQKGLDFSVPKEEQKNYHFCVSIGTKGDQHVQKARINFMNCKQCAKCYHICPQSAINPYYQVSNKKCIGCLKCKQVCEHNAVEIYSKSNPVNLPLPYHHSLLTCIELHASDIIEEEVDDIWSNLNKNFEGMLSLCIGRSKLSDQQVVERIKRLVSEREPYTTIIQADGSPMSGGQDDYKTTLQAVATAELIQGAKLPVYLVVSGGTNSKTAELAKHCGVNLNGVSVGSYARKTVKEYIEREDFLKNKLIFDEALTRATNFIRSITLDYPLDKQIKNCG